MSLLSGLLLGLQSPPVDFAREIRPLLAEHCFACHGPDEGARKGRLRLDTAEGERAPRKGRPALVPGRPEESELYRRISADDPEERMPPADSNRLPLTEEERARVRRWIATGGEYAPHWAYRAPERAPLPEVRDSTWCRDALDVFVLARLEAAGLAPNPQAEPEVLLRRLSFGLAGLPPTAEELDAFLVEWAREPERAWDGAVEHLFASPHHAEHLATQWLDLARYADTYGYQADVERRVWPWRDWVIRAFAANMP